LRSFAPAKMIWSSKVFLALSLILWNSFVFISFFLHPVDPLPSLKFLLQIDRFPQVTMSQKITIWSGFLSTVLLGSLAVAIFWNVGRRLGNTIGLRYGGGITGFILDFGLGVFFFNALWLGLGLTRSWFPILWWTGLLFFSGMLIWDVFNEPRRKKELLSLIPKPSGWGETSLVLVGVLYLFILLPHCLVPETFYDSLNYFLGMPQYWLSHHGIVDDTAQLLSGYFHGGSLFFMSGFVFQGTEGAKFLNVVVLVLCALFSFGWVKEMGSSSAGIAAFTATLTFPLLFLNSWAVRVDGLICLFTLLFLYSVSKTLEKTEGVQSWWLAAFLFAGTAFSIKPTAITLIGSAILAFLWVKGPKVFKDRTLWLLGAGVFLVTLGPWFFKNEVFAGNPFFPYVSHWFGGRQIPPAGYERLLGENRQFLPMDHGLLSILQLPWRLTMPQAGDGQFIGPILLGFLPLLFLARFQQSAQRFLVRVTLLVFVLGLCLSHMLRFVMPGFLLAFILLSALLMDRKEKVWKTLWTSALLISAVLCLGTYLDLSARFYDPIGVIMGRETPTAYLERKNLNTYEPMVRWIDENLAQDASLLVVGDARGVYYPRTFIANSAFDRPFFEEAALEGKDPSDILLKLRRSGITHLAVNIPEGQRLSADYHQYTLSVDQWKILDQFLRQGLTPVYFKDYLAVYEVKKELSPSTAPYVVDPFSFFYGPSIALRRHIQSGDLTKADKESDLVLLAFPHETYWWEKKAFILAKLGKKERALATYDQAHRLGGMTLEAYGAWAQLAKAAGKPGAYQAILGEREKAYPGLSRKNS